MSIMPPYGGEWQQAPQVVIAGAVSTSASRLLATVDAIMSNLIAQKAPANLINAIRAAALNIDHAQQRGRIPTHLIDTLDITIAAAGRWLLEHISVHDRIEAIRRELHVAMETAQSHAIRFQLAGALQEASGLLVRGDDTPEAIEAFERQARAALMAAAATPTPQTGEWEMQG